MVNNHTHSRPIAPPIGSPTTQPTILPPAKPSEGPQLRRKSAQKSPSPLTTFESFATFVVNNHTHSRPIAPPIGSPQLNPPFSHQQSQAKGYHRAESPHNNPSAYPQLSRLSQLSWSKTTLIVDQSLRRLDPPTTHPTILPPAKPKRSKGPPPRRKSPKESPTQPHPEPFESSASLALKNSPPSPPNYFPPQPNTQLPSTAPEPRDTPVQPPVPTTTVAAKKPILPTRPPIAQIAQTIR
ncbi:hypothetical protein FHS27_002069 [Rhodopirellula rubra]|uniref:Uncharacterized protein n=1 Tax=Aporhodopirellula rubra TaxID=980271 RepID=A0A7W5H5T7_9BACT|nr:hypothetical protein [Aporhodopirellula rubra]